MYRRLGPAKPESVQIKYNNAPRFKVDARPAEQRNNDKQFIYQASFYATNSIHYLDQGFPNVFFVRGPHGYYTTLQFEGRRPYVM